MKTLLFKDNTSNEIKTFLEVKQDYIDKYNSELPITNDEMLLIALTSDNISVIRDDIIAWCNDFSDYNEADRYLSKVERDESIKTIYEYIYSNDNYLADIQNLLDDDNMEESRELLDRLENILMK